MSALILHVDGLEVHAASTDAEPMVRDLDLAGRLGYTHPRNVRKLISRLVGEGTLNDSEYRSTVERHAVGTGGGFRNVTEYWLSESGAIKVAARSDTPEAIKVLDHVVRVYREAMRMMREGKSITSTVADAALLAQQTTRIADLPGELEQVKNAIGFACWKTRASWSWVEGHIRRVFSVTGYTKLILANVPAALSLLASVAAGMLPPKLPAPYVDPRQTTFAFAHAPKKGLPR